MTRSAKHTAASRENTVQRNEVVVHESRYCIDENHYVVASGGNDTVPVMPPGNYHPVIKTDEGYYVLQNSTSLDRMMWDMIISKLHFDARELPLRDNAAEYASIVRDARSCFSNADELLCVDMATGGALDASCFPKLFERNWSLRPSHKSCYAGADAWVVSLFCRLFGPHGNCGLNVRSSTALYGIGVELFCALNEFRAAVVDPMDHHLFHSFGHGGVGYLLAMQVALDKHFLTEGQLPRKNEKDWWCSEAGAADQPIAGITGEVLAAAIPDDNAMMSAKVAHSVQLGRDHFASVCKDVCVPLFSRFFTDALGVCDGYVRSRVHAFLGEEHARLNAPQARGDWVRTNFARLCANHMRLVYAYNAMTKDFRTSLETHEQLAAAIENTSSNERHRMVVRTFIDDCTRHFPFEKAFPKSALVFAGASRATRTPGRETISDYEPPLAVQLSPLETCAMLWVSSSGAENE